MRVPILELGGETVTSLFPDTGIDEATIDRSVPDLDTTLDLIRSAFETCASATLDSLFQKTKVEYDLIPDSQKDSWLCDYILPIIIHVDDLKLLHLVDAFTSLDTHAFGHIATL